MAWLALWVFIQVFSRNIVSAKVNQTWTILWYNKFWSWKTQHKSAHSWGMRLCSWSPICRGTWAEDWNIWLWAGQSIPWRKVKKLGGIHLEARRHREDIRGIFTQMRDVMAIWIQTSNPIPRTNIRTKGWEPEEIAFSSKKEIPRTPQSCLKGKSWLSSHCVLWQRQSCRRCCRGDKIRLGQRNDHFTSNSKGRFHFLKKNLSKYFRDIFIPWWQQTNEATLFILMGWHKCQLNNFHF